MEDVCRFIFCASEAGSKLTELKGQKRGIFDYEVLDGDNCSAMEHAVSESGGLFCTGGF